MSANSWQHCPKCHAGRTNDNESEYNLRGDEEMFWKDGYLEIHLNYTCQDCNFKIREHFTYLPDDGRMERN